MPSLRDRIEHAWNAFRSDQYSVVYNEPLGPGYTTKPDLTRLSGAGTERSIVWSIYNRIGIDVASVPIQHVRLDENGRYLEPIKSGLNNCLTLQANIDQSGRAFIQDVAESLCDEGTVALVPVDTTLNPNLSGSFDIITMRTAEVMVWYPKHVQVNLYNDESGMYQQIILPKSMVAIIQNPLYSVMNEPNSTLQRLISKLYLLDVVDQQSGSGKLDLIIQLPFVIKTAARQQQAENRKASIEAQLKDSKYGIAYTDGTEKITQLNRPAENNLMGQIEFLTSMLYSQLGLSKEIFEGTADEAQMLNYYNRTIEPILSAVVDGMKRTFITKTGRSQGQSIIPLRDPFKLVPVGSIADIADKFTRNEILSSNEVRGIIGFKPSKDPEADELRNKNLNSPAEDQTQSEPASTEDKKIKMEGVPNK